jgi:very-short-patch-repair endonuclease
VAVVRRRVGGGGLLVPDADFIVEIDGAGPHWSRWRKRKDREKAARFEASGTPVWRVAELRLAVDRAALVAEARAFAATVGRRKEPPRTLS